MSSFNAPAQPKLPGGWNVPVEPVAASAQPSGAGTGGLYGAPMAPMAGMGRDGAGAAERPTTRTMQLTARPAGDGRDP